MLLLVRARSPRHTPAVKRPPHTAVPCSVKIETKGIASQKEGAGHSGNRVLQKMPRYYPRTRKVENLALAAIARYMSSGINQCVQRGFLDNRWHLGWISRIEAPAPFLANTFVIPDDSFRPLSVGSCSKTATSPPPLDTITFAKA